MSGRCADLQPCRRSADLDVEALALMHGPAFNGDCAGAPRDLADGYAKLFADASANPAVD